MSHFNTLVPTVVEKDPKGQERYFDIYSRLLKDYVVFVTGPIDMIEANTFIAQLLFLESEDPKRTINIYINTPGGSVHSGMAMYDTIKLIKNPISTINVGLAASAGALLLGAGDKGKRFSLPYAKTMIHEARIMGGGMTGPTTDLEIEIEELKRNTEDYATIISKASGQPIKKVKEDIKRDKWFDAKETIEYGLIDEILKPKK